MEDAVGPRAIWEGDAKAVQQCLTDIFTSVYTTCDIPANAIFGPCALSHTSLYDSIAFIALKSSDKRTVPYIFRVDTSAANGSSEGLMWLRLVQSARDKEEQNLEAYIKSGQLFYRSLRRIAKDEELLVWYGKELSELLLLLLLAPARVMNAAKMNGSSPYTCLECSQRFQFEFPYVAHLRFRCPKRLHVPDSHPSDESSPKANSPKAQPDGHVGPGVTASKYLAGKPGGGQPQLQPHHPAPHRPHYACQPPADAAPVSNKPSTDFHNLARDMENARGGSSDSAARRGEPVEVGPEGDGKAKRKYPAGEQRGRLARPGPSASPEEELVCTPQQQYRPAGSYFGLEESSRLFAPPSPETGEAKRSAFVEVKASRGAAATGDEKEPERERERGSPPGPAADKAPAPGLLGGGRSGASAFSTVASSQPSSALATNPEERKSAFSQPARSSSFSAPSVSASGAAASSASLSSSSSSTSTAAASSATAHVTQLVLSSKLSALVEGGGGGGCHEGTARLYAPDPLAVKLQSGAADGGAAGGGLPKQSPFLYAAASTTFWPKSSVAAAAAPLQLHLPSALTLLPPSFTSLCLPAQNWCAKCNASFRMTSDLVYHMRSHHKKEYALEPLVKRRREEKLKCPICNESFRERHHLSRHMTSHN